MKRECGLLVCGSSGPARGHPMPLANPACSRARLLVAGARPRKLTACCAQGKREEAVMVAKYIAEVGFESLGSALQP